MATSLASISWEWTFLDILYIWYLGIDHSNYKKPWKLKYSIYEGFLWGILYWFHMDNYKKHISYSLVCDKIFINRLYSNNTVQGNEHVHLE